MGGTCALRGCDPKKVLVGAAELTDWNRRMTDRGVVGQAEISWPDLMRFKRTFTGPVSAARQEAFTKAGIATYCGPAQFVGPDKLSVDGQVLDARHFVIAAGAKPRRLGIPGEEHLVTSTDFLELDRLPARIAFIGAGYISFEFSRVLSLRLVQSRRSRVHLLLGMNGDRVRQHSEGTGIARRIDVSQRGKERCAESELPRPRQGLLQHGLRRPSDAVEQVRRGRAQPDQIVPPVMRGSEDQVMLVEHRQRA